MALPNISKPTLERKAAAEAAHLAGGHGGLRGQPKALPGLRPEVATCIGSPGPGGLPPQLRPGRGILVRLAAEQTGQPLHEIPAGCSRPERRHIIEHGELIKKRMPRPSARSLNVPVLGSLASVAYPSPPSTGCLHLPDVAVSDAQSVLVQASLRQPRPQAPRWSVVPAPAPRPARGGSEGLGGLQALSMPRLGVLGRGRKKLHCPGLSRVLSSCFALSGHGSHFPLPVNPTSTSEVPGNRREGTDTGLLS